MWAAIIVARIALDHLLLQKPDAGSWFDLISGVFIVAVAIAEASIIYRASKAYSRSANSNQARSTGLSGKMLLPLFFFCLPYGLWNSRRSILDMAPSIPGGRWIEIAGLAAGCGFNLVVSGAIVHSMLAARSRSNQVDQQ